MIIIISSTKQKNTLKLVVVSLVDKTHVGFNFDRDQNNKKKHKTQKSKLKEIFF